MKLAVPTRDNHIDEHFGHCEYYTIYTIENDKIVEKITMPSPEGCGCKSNIAAQFQEMGVTVMLAGNMGEGAKVKLANSGIQAIRGCSGPTDEVVTDYINGKISDSGVSCANHDGHHECHHNG